MVIAARLAIATAGFMALAPNAAAQDRERQQQAAELRILHEQHQQMSLALTQLIEMVKALKTSLDEVSAATRKGAADQELSMRNVRGDLSAIRERAQETDASIRVLRDEVDALLARLSNSAVPSGPAASQPVDVPRMLATARSDYYDERWDLAIAGFDALIKACPRCESASEAQYFIGESYYSQKKWPEAIDAFGLVLQSHPKSSWVPDAYRRRGQAYVQINQLDAARVELETVVRSFPDSDAARLANQELQRLKRTPAVAK